MRADRRAGRATEEPPPDQNNTDPPTWANADTAETADREHEPIPPAPNAAKHKPERGAAAPRAARTTASKPTQHPTDTDRPEVRTEPTTEPTRGAKAAPRERDPAKATTPDTLSRPRNRRGNNHAS